VDISLSLPRYIVSRVQYCGRKPRPQKATCNPTFRLRPGKGALGKAVIVGIDAAL